MAPPRDYPGVHQDRIADEAAEWFVRLNDPEAGPGLRGAFADWLGASADHVREYLQLAALQTDIAALSIPVSEEELVARFHSSGQNAIVDLAQPRPGAAKPARPRNSLYPRVALAAVALGALAVWLWAGFSATVYRTGIGEQRSFPLPDGSLVTLNAVSELRLQFTGQSRDLELVSGEALFEVAPNPRQPFRVRSGSALIRALGTRFNVYHRNDAVSVTVVDGLVEVRNDDKPLRVARGEQARLPHPSEPLLVSRVDVRRETAWRERRLVFDSRPLGAVVAEFNLYNDVPMVVKDAALSEVRVSGAFFANDPRSFAMFLEGAGLAAVEREGRALCLVAPAAKAVED